MDALREYERGMAVLGWCLVLWYAGLSCITHNVAETVPHYSGHPALYSLQPLMSCKNSLKLPLSAQDRPSQKPGGSPPPPPTFLPVSRLIS